MGAPFVMRCMALCRAKPQPPFCLIDTVPFAAQNSILLPRSILASVFRAGCLCRGSRSLPRS